MGWTAYYQILRDRPLTDAELVALDDYITESNRPPWDSESFGLAVTREARADRVLGEGWQKLAMSLDESDDAERLCTTLEGLRDVITGVEIRISDDFGAFGVDGIEICLNARPGPALVEVSREERAQFAAPSTFVGVRHAQVAVPAELDDALLALARMDDAHPQRAELLARVAAAPAAEVAAAGFGEHYRELRAAHDTWRLVDAALESLDDVEPIVDGFLDVWYFPHGINWYGDISLPAKTRDALARVPEIEAVMRDDLEVGVQGSDSDIVHRRAEHAAHMLGRARTPSALAALVGAARTLRGRPMSSAQLYHTSVGIQAGLVLAAVEDVVPTLLLGFEGRLFRHHMDALSVLARLAPERALPILRACAAQGEALWELIPALHIARDAETLRALCAFPIQRDRERAAEALRALGEEPPAVDAVPAPETLVTHASETVRRHALLEIERTRDPAMMTSVVAVHVLEAAIGRRFGGATGSYGEYFALLPDDLRYAPHTDQLAALLAGRVPGLPDQVLWPSILPILDGKADELAARFPPATVRLDDAALAQLRDEEAAIIVKLGGKLPPAPAAREPAPAPAPAPAPPPTPAPTAAAPAAPASPAPSPTADEELIDALLVAMAREQNLDDATRMRAQLRADLGSLSRWDREKEIRTRLVELGPALVGNRLLANLTELHDGGGVSDLAELVLPHVAKEPGGARRIADAWESAYALPWRTPSRAEAQFRGVASLSELFERALDDVAAPDGGGPLSSRTSGGFELVANAVERRDDATAAIVARIRIDRGRPSSIVGWRGDSYRALRRCGGDAAVPTAALELAELATVTRGSALPEILSRTPRGRELLAQTIDLPELAVDAVRELVRGHEDLRIRYLEHPYWRVRLAAADSNPVWARSKVEMFAVWAAIDAAGLPVHERDRAYARPSDAPETATWDDLARTHGRPITLLALPPARDGLAHGCADYRTWALWAVDERLDPADAVARVFADELDAALVAFGHARHGAVWPRWRERVPGLPADRRGRLAWASEQPAATLPASLAAVRDRGAAAVAADLPRPHLSLAPELRAELEALERPLAERGLRLFEVG
jgi:cell division septation protein DedD